MSLLRSVNRLRYVAFPFGNLKADVDIRSVVKMWHPDYGNVSRKYRIIKCCNPILQRSRVVLSHVRAYIQTGASKLYIARSKMLQTHIYTHKYIHITFWKVSFLRTLRAVLTTFPKCKSKILEILAWPLGVSARYRNSRRLLSENFIKFRAFFE